MSPQSTFSTVEWAWGFVVHEVKVMVVLERRAKRHRYLSLSFDGMGMSNNNDIYV